MQPETIDVQIGEKYAVIKRSDRSEATVAKVLFRRENSSGHVVYAVLDSLVHDGVHSKMGDYEVTGCFVTELKRIGAKVPEWPKAN